MRTYSTSEVAKATGVHKATLLRWLYTGKVSEPEQQRVAGLVVRVWTDKDLERVIAFKAAHYWEGRGRQPAAK